jgi:hypothetical protein
VKVVLLGGLGRDTAARLRKVGHEVEECQPEGSHAWPFLYAAEAVILQAPAGRVDALAFGWACGAKKITAILCPEDDPLGHPFPAFARLALADLTTTDLDGVLELLAVAPEIPS